MTEKEKQEIRAIIKEEIELKLQPAITIDASKEKPAPDSPETRNINVETVSPTY
ncbi:MAG TPA: hypothetical protein VD927_09180 [Chryseosolibacter sp.]|nr:hypothetical protein [Chryseosolibacter sp.]